MRACVFLLQLRKWIPSLELILGNIGGAVVENLVRFSLTFFSSRNKDTKASDYLGQVVPA